MLLSSVVMKLTIDVTCRYPGYDRPALVANNLYLNDIRFEMKRKMLEVEDIPAVLERMDACLGFCVDDYYGIDDLIDGRGEINRYTLFLLRAFF